jgi:hypothetical protein
MHGQRKPSAERSRRKRSSALIQNGSQRPTEPAILVLLPARLLGFTEPEDRLEQAECHKQHECGRIKALANQSGLSATSHTVDEDPIRQMPPQLQVEDELYCVYT